MKRVIAREWLVLVMTLVISLAVIPPMLVLKSTRVDRPSIWIETETCDTNDDFWKSFEKIQAFSRSPEGKAAQVEERKLGWRYTFDQAEAVKRPFREKWERRTTPEYLHRSRVAAWKAFYLSLIGAGMYGSESARVWLVVLLPYGVVQFMRSLLWAGRQVKR